MAATSSKLPSLNLRNPVAYYVANFVGAITSGAKEPAEVFIEISKMGEIIKKVKENPIVRNAVLDSISRRGDNNMVSTIECKLEIAETGVKYDYSTCGDPVLEKLYELKGELDLQIKQREAMLKNIRPGCTIVDDETGEVCTVYPPAKSSTTAPKITFFNKK